MAKKRMNKKTKKLWNLWTSIATAILLIIIGGSMASGALGFPAFLNWIPSVLAVIVGWFFIIASIIDIVFSLLDTINTIV